MTDLQIDERLFRELEEIAKREGRSTEEIAQSLVERYVLSRRFSDASTFHSESTPINTKDPFLLIAQGADELGLSSEQDNISELSREILALELPKYLMERLKQQEDDNSDEQPAG